MAYSLQEGQFSSYTLECQDSLYEPSVLMCIHSHVFTYVCEYAHICSYAQYNLCIYTNIYIYTHATYICMYIHV